MLNNLSSGLASMLAAVILLAAVAMPAPPAFGQAIGLPLITGGSGLNGAPRVGDVLMSDLSILNLNPDFGFLDENGDGDGDARDIFLKFQQSSDDDIVWRDAATGFGPLTYTVIEGDVRFRLQASWTATKPDDGGQLELYVEYNSAETPLAVYPPFTVSFSSAAYDAPEGAGVEITVRLDPSAAPGQFGILEFGLITTGDTDDLLGVPETVSFFGNLSEMKFTVTAANDGDFDDETVTIAIDGDNLPINTEFPLDCDLDSADPPQPIFNVPPGCQSFLPAKYPPDEPFYEVGNTGTTTVTLRDDGPKEVNFASNAYTAVEGGAGVEVTVLLNQAPDETLVIPLKGRAGSSTDFTGAPAYVSFAPAVIDPDTGNVTTPGQTEASFTVTATDDTEIDDDTLTIYIDDTSADLPASYVVGAINETVITLQEDGLSVVSLRNPPEVNLLPNNITPDTVTFTVERSGGTDTAVTVPLDIRASVDAPVVPDLSDLPECIPGNVLCPPLQLFGTRVTILSAQFAAGETTTTATVSIDAAGSALGAFPSYLTATVILPGTGYKAGTTLYATAQIDAPPLFAVSIASEPSVVVEGEEFVFTVTRTPVDGVTPLLADLAVLIEVDISGLFPEGEFPEGEFPEGKYRETVVIPAGDDHGHAVPLTIPDDDVDLPTRRLVATVIAGEDYAAPAPGNRVDVTVLDNDGPPEVFFAAESYEAVEDGADAVITILLSHNNLSSDLTIPVVVEELGVATAADWSITGVTVSGSSVTFAAATATDAAETRKTFRVTATEDEDDDSDESLRISFGTLPVSVMAGSLTETIVNLVNTYEALPRLGLLAPVVTYDDADVTPDTVEFTVERREVVNTRVVVIVRGIYASSNRDAVVGGDAVQVGMTQQLIFDAGETRKTLTVDLEEALLDTLGRNSGYLFLIVGQATGYRVDPPGRVDTSRIVFPIEVSFDANAYTAVEGGADAVITVQLSSAVEAEDGTLLVSLVTTPEFGADFEASSSSVTFAPGAVEATFMVTATGDLNADDGEVTIAINPQALASPLTAGHITETVVTLVDDGLPAVSLRAPVVNFLADGITPDTVEFTVERSVVTDTAITVNHLVFASSSVGATAAAAEDIPLDSNVLDFAAGDLTKTVTVDIDFALMDTLQRNSGYLFAIIEPGPGSYRIDPAAERAETPRIAYPIEVSFALAGYEAVEGGANAEITVQLSRALEAGDVPLDVPLVVAFGSSGDWEIDPAFVSFAPGDPRMKTLVVTATDDLDAIDEEVTLQINGSGLSLPYVPGDIGETVITLRDDKLPVVSLGATVVSGGDAIFTVERSVVTDTAVTVALEVTVSADASGGNPIVIPTASPFFPVGVLSKTLPVDIEGALNKLGASPGYLTVDVQPETGYKPGMSPSVTKLIRTSLFPFTVSIAADTDEITEGDDAVFTLTRALAGSNTLFPELEVEVELVSVDSNRTLEVGTAFFVEDETEAKLTFDMPVRDDTVYQRDPRTIVARVVDGGFGYAPAPAPDDEAEVTVLDNEFAPHVSFASNAYTAVEGGAGVDVIVRLSQTPDGPVEIPLRARAGSSTDFTGAPAFVRFAAGVAEATFTVTATDDPDADDETLTIYIDDTTALLPFPYVVGNIGETVITLQDDGLPVVSLGAPVVSGGVVTFTVVRSGGTDTAISVLLAVVASSNDPDVFIPGIDPGGFSLNIPLVEFAIGDVMQTAEIPFEPVLQNLGETSGYLTAAVLPGTGYKPGTTARVTAQIETPVLVPFMVSIVADTAEITEGDGVDFTLTRALVPPNTLFPELEVVVELAFSDGGEFAMMPVTFLDNESVAVLSITVPEDDIPQPTRTLTAMVLDGGEDYAAGSPDSAVVTVLDNDGPLVLPEVNFAAATYTAVEGDAGVEVTVRLNAPSVTTLEIPLVTEAGAGALFSVEPPSVSFLLGEDEATFMVAALDDTNADDETVMISIAPAQPSSGYVVGTLSATVVTLEDDGLPFVSLRDPPEITTADGTVRFTVLRNVVTDTAITVSLDVTVSDDAFGTGLSATSIQVLSVALEANETTKDVTVDFEDALTTLGARDGYLTATVLPGTDYKPGTTARVTAPIDTQMPESAPFTVSITADMGVITEGDNAVFTVTRALVPPHMLLNALAVEVDISGDGAPVSGIMTVTIDPGDLTADLTIQIPDDAIPQGNRAIVAMVQDGGQDYNAPAPGNRAAVSIEDNDGPADMTPPTLLWGTINWNVVVLKFSEPIDPSAAHAIYPNSGSTLFTVSGIYAAGLGTRINSSTVEGDTLTLKLGNDGGFAGARPDLGRNVLINYFPPTSTTPPVQDLAGNPLVGRDEVTGQLVIANDPLTNIMPLVVVEAVGVDEAGEAAFTIARSSSSPPGLSLPALTVMLEVDDGLTVPETTNVVMAASDEVTKVSFLIPEGSTGIRVTLTGGCDVAAIGSSPDYCVPLPGVDGAEAEVTVPGLPGVPVISLAPSPVISGGDAIFTVERSGETDTAVTVTLDITASAEANAPSSSNADTSITRREVRFAAGETSKDVRVNIEDALNELGVTSGYLTAEIMPSADYSIDPTSSGPAQVAISVPGLPGVPVISLAPSPVISGGDAIFTVERSGETDTAVTVTLDITASAEANAPSSRNADTSITRREVRFAAGETSKDVRVNIEDALNELGVTSGYLTAEIMPSADYSIDPTSSGTVTAQVAISVLAEPRRRGAAIMLRRHAARFEDVTSSAALSRLQGHSPGAFTAHATTQGLTLDGAWASDPEDRAGWSFWGDMSYARINGAGEGKEYDIYLGLDYLHGSGRYVIGGLLGHERGDLTVNDASFSSRFTEIGLYGATRLNETLIMDGALGYGFGKTELSQNGVAAEPDARRLTLRAGLTGDLNWGSEEMRIAPQIGLLHVRETLDAFVDSAGGVASERELELTRIGLGPQVTGDFAGGTFVGQARVNWDSNNLDGARMSEVSGSLDGRLHFELDEGLTAEISAGVDGLGVDDGYRAYNVGIRLNAEF